MLEPSVFLQVIVINVKTSHKVLIWFSNRYLQNLYFVFPDCSVKIRNTHTHTCPHHCILICNNAPFCMSSLVNHVPIKNENQNCWIVLFFLFTQLSFSGPLFLIRQKNDATGSLSIVCQVEWRRDLAMSLTSMKTKVMAFFLSTTWWNEG